MSKMRHAGASAADANANAPGSSDVRAGLDARMEWYELLDEGLDVLDVGRWGDNCKGTDIDIHRFGQRVE